MRYIRLATFFSLAALLALGLSACDFSEQNYDIEPGDELEIRGPGEVAVPAGEASYYVIPFTINKEYTWSVTDADGNDVPFETRRDGEFLDVTFEEPGDYTISVASSGQGDEYSGSISIVAAYPDLPGQVSRFGFGTLAAAIDAAGLADALAEDGPFTVLAPTDEAFVAAFDTTAEGELNTPSPGVLAEILQYHVLPTSLASGDIANGQSESTLLEGTQVSFSVSGETITVVDGNPDTEDATVTDADVPASNGLFHAVDQVLLPSTAAVEFQDQESEDGQTVVVASVYLPEGGFIAIHEQEDDGSPGAVVGASDYLDAGFHNGVEITLDNPVADGTALGAMPHRDTNDNQTYDFGTIPGEDGPYTRDGGPVIDYATITVP